MADEVTKLDENGKWVAMGVTNDSNLFKTMLRVDPSTKRLLVDAGTITTSSASVGATGASVPTSADFQGIQDGSGNLQGVRQIVNALNSTGAGILSAGLVGQFDDSSPTTITENQFGNVRMSNRREVYVQLRDAAGNERGLNIDGNGAIAITVASLPSQNVTNVGTFAVQATPVTQADTFMLGGVNIKEINAVTPLMGNGGTGTGSLRMTLASDNSAIPLWGHGVIASGVPANAVYQGISDGTNLRGVLGAANALNSTGAGLPTAQIIGQFDDVSPTAITENQFGNLRMSANRNLYGTLRDAAGNERGANVTSANELNVLDSASSATAASVPSKASYLGLRGTTALPTAVTDGQTVGSLSDKYGRNVALISTIRDLVLTQGTTISNSTSETTIGTAVASTFLDIIMLIFSNTSASSNTRLDIRDTTAGSVLFSLQSNGGQPPIGFALPTPIPQTSVNTNWTVQCASAVTDIRAYLVAAKNK